MQAAAKSNMKVVSLELGSKSPLIVFNDADLETVAELATTSITFSKCGILDARVVDLTLSFEDSDQICTASSRLYVQAGVADKFKTLLVERVEKIKLGSPSEDESDMGPQADSKQADAVTSYVEEVFGLVLVLHTFATAEEAVQLANDTECEYPPILVVFACPADVDLMRQDGLYAFGLQQGCRYCLECRSGVGSRKRRCKLLFTL